VTPEEARRIDQQEFEADCRAVRDRVFARIAERHGAERARVLRWVNDTREPQKRMRWVTLPPRPTPAVSDPVPTYLRRGSRSRTKGPQWAFGEERTLTEWAAHLGISPNTLHQRIYRTGSLEDAIMIGGPRPRGRSRGVHADFRERSGTGGGSVAQDFTQIGISQ